MREGDGDGGEGGEEREDEGEGGVLTGCSRWYRVEVERGEGRGRELPLKSMLL